MKKYSARKKTSRSSHNAHTHKKWSLAKGWHKRLLAFLGILVFVGSVGGVTFYAANTFKGTSVLGAQISQAQKVNSDLSNLCIVTNYKDKCYYGTGKQGIYGMDTPDAKSCNPFFYPHNTSLFCPILQKTMQTVYVFFEAPNGALLNVPYKEDMSTIQKKQIKIYSETKIYPKFNTYVPVTYIRGVGGINTIAQILDNFGLAKDIKTEFEGQAQVPVYNLKIPSLVELPGILNLPQSAENTIASIFTHKYFTTISITSNDPGYFIFSPEKYTPDDLIKYLTSLQAYTYVLPFEAKLNPSYKNLCLRQPGGVCIDSGNLRQYQMVIREGKVPGNAVLNQECADDNFNTPDCYVDASASATITPFPVKPSPTPAPASGLSIDVSMFTNSFSSWLQTVIKSKPTITPVPKTACQTKYAGKCMSWSECSAKADADSRYDCDNSAQFGCPSAEYCSYIYQTQRGSNKSSMN